MSAGGGPSSYGYVFDAVAEAYDRERPLYPAALVDRALEVGELHPGDPVLEVGCGTGQLTQALVGRGLRVTAVEPGANMIRVARRKFSGDQVRFVNARFEDADVEDGAFRALFSATAFHWVDPRVGWRRAADALEPGGMLGLLQFCGVSDERSAPTQAAVQAALERVAPELAAERPMPPSPEDLVAGARSRSGNVSEVWAWVTQHQLAVDNADALFDRAAIDVVDAPLEVTPAQTEAHFRTTSLCYRLGPERADALLAEERAFAERTGGKLAFSELGVLVTARRRGV